MLLCQAFEMLPQTLTNQFSYLLKCHHFFAEIIRINRCGKQESICHVKENFRHLLHILIGRFLAESIARSHCLPEEARKCLNLSYRMSGYCRYSFVSRLESAASKDTCARRYIYFSEDGQMIMIDSLGY